MRKFLLKRLLRYFAFIMKNSPDLKHRFVKEGNKIIDLPDSLGFDEKREAEILRWIWERGPETINKIIARYL